MDMPKSASEDPGHRCDACGKSFSTNSHLRRHGALHSGKTSAVCPSCNRSFSRLDTARRHVKACSPHGVGPLVAESKRGKARQACDICAQRKLSCDGSSPCTRCVFSKVMCTYEYRRHNLSRPTSPLDTSMGESGLPTAARSVGTASAASRGKVPIEFLLAFTTPAEHEATTTLVLGSRNNPTGQSIDIPLESSSTFDFNFECYGPLFWDHENWTADFIDYSKGGFPEDVNQHIHPSAQRPVDTIIETRLAHMSLQLASKHALLLANNPNSRVEFDKSLAEQVFTAANLENSIEAYFRELHQCYPFVHRPSFSCKTVSLPLLLAIFLFGSLASAPTDSTLSAREFFDIAEEYIFDHPNMQSLPYDHTNWEWSDEKIEVLQAVLIIEIVQNGTNNVGTRRRLRTKRLPRYIAALKSCGLFQSAGKVQVHTSDTVQSRWQSFISREIRTRLAVWAFVTDSCFAVMFNSCPLVAIAELNFDFPCRDEIFEAETAAEYERLVMVDCPELPCQTPSQFTKILLQDACINIDHRHVTAMHLMVTIIAIQSLTMTLRYSHLLQETERTILRAADRWENLWHTVTGGNEPGPGSPPRRGFVKHSEELCWFVRKLVQAGRLEAPDCRYTQIVPTDKIKDLHDFLCKYRMI